MPAFNPKAQPVRRSASAVAARPKHTYSVYFPENKIEGHPGYLLIKPLGSGSYGVALLVLSLADGSVCVRKIDKESNPSVDSKHRSAEVRNHISHDNIPKLISYTHYSMPIPGTNKVRIKFATTQKFCNGGTLAGLTAHIYIASQAHLTAAGYPQIRPQLPEVFLWRFFDSMLSALTACHEKGITHTDMHQANIFLNWTESRSMLPRVFLGDFGESVSYPWAQHKDKRFNRPFQIDSLSELDRIHQESHKAFNRHHVHHWYKEHLRDMKDIMDLVAVLMVSSPESSVKRAAGIRTAAERQRGVNGYSADLSTYFKALSDYVFNLRDGLSPYKALSMQQNLQKSVHRRAKKAEHDFHHGDRHAPNFLSIHRPALPKAEPATWSESSKVVANRGAAVAQIEYERRRAIDSPHGRANVSWDVSIDWNMFEICRVTYDKAQKCWKVSPRNDRGHERTRAFERQPQRPRGNSITALFGMLGLGRDPGAMPWLH